MKICFAQRYHLSERVGGAEVQSWLLAVELAKRGHTVSYIAESLGEYEGTTEMREGVRICWIPRGRRTEFTNLPHYYNLLKELSPDLIIQRLTCAYTAVAARYAENHSVPFLWICTDDSIPFRWSFARRQQALSRRYKVGLLKRTVLLMFAALRDIAKNYGISRASHVATQNELQASALLREFGRDSGHFHSGYPLPEQLGAKDDPPLVLWVGDISHKKRPEMFVELADACKDLELRFGMICKKPASKDQQRCDAIAAHPETNERFEWIGPTPLEVTNQWFERATVYVSTSAPGGDGFPNTFVQAWLRRAPVLSFGTDPDKVVATRGLGRVVRTVKDAREALQSMLAAGENEELADRVQRYAQQKHSIESVADHMFSIVADSILVPATETEPALATASNVGASQTSTAARTRLVFAERRRLRELRELRAENEQLKQLVRELTMQSSDLGEATAQGRAESVQFHV